uniref:Apple domain-containing protein n=1 Tax=Strongyloides stercoralis TaxID=6248 RepID=A0A0K0EJ06_STRER
MLDKKVKIHGIIFLCGAIDGALSIWAMLVAISYKLTTKYTSTSIALTSIIVVAVIILCLAAVFKVREEYLSIIYTLMVIPISECRYLVLSLSLAASIDGIICIISASVLRYYYKIPIPTDKWYCNSSWP